MRSRLRFHLDEQMNGAVAIALRKRQIFVSTTPEAGLLGADDTAQLAYAHQHGCVLVTQDEDYLVLNARGYPHSRIVYYHPHSRTLGQVIRRLVKLHEDLTPEEMVGRVQYL